MFMQLMSNTEMDPAKLETGVSGTCDAILMK